MAAEETAHADESAGCQAHLVQADLTDVSECTRLFDEAKSKFGEINIAVNTVGKVLKKPFTEMAAINSKVAYFFLQEAGKKLGDNGKVCTIVTSLLAAYPGFYSTSSKFSVILPQPKLVFVKKPN